MKKEKDGAEPQALQQQELPLAGDQPQASPETAPSVDVFAVPEKNMSADELDKVKTIAKKQITSEDIATTEELKTAAKAQAGLVKVDYEKIVIRKGFNLRTNYGDLEALADSIESQGLLKPMTVDILHDGTSPLVDGERRYRAIGILRKRSPELKEKWASVHVLIGNKKADEKDRIITMMASNTGKSFEPMEEAEGFRRLRDEHGMKDLKTIAEAVGRSVPYVEQRLILADAAPEEKKSIELKLITPTAFVELSRITRDVEERKEIIHQATEGGKKKAKVKDIKKAKDNTKSSKKVEVEDMKPPKSLKKTISAEVQECVKTALAELKEVKGMRMQGNIEFAFKECEKQLRKINKLVTS